MRTTPATDGKKHAGSNPLPHDHHNRPESFSISSTGTQSLPPGTTYDLDIDLGRTGYTYGRVYLEGPRTMSGSGVLWQECAEVVVTTDSADARSHSVRDSNFKKVYAGHYSKPQGDAWLSHKIFDSATGLTQRYIALLDAWITGSTLRLRFHNYFGGSAFLWVEGQAVMR